MQFDRIRTISRVWLASTKIKKKSTRGKIQRQYFVFDAEELTADASVINLIEKMDWIFFFFLFLNDLKEILAINKIYVWRLVKLKIFKGVFKIS